jgi:hypothetical protein
MEGSLPENTAKRQSQFGKKSATQNSRKKLYVISSQADCPALLGIA